MPRYGEEWFESAGVSLRVLETRLKSCTLCPRSCGVDRPEGETGYCGGGASARVSSVFSHFGEEPPLVGNYGSGTVFFAGCNLKCVFCQNFSLSHGGEGEDRSTAGLARAMLQLEAAGCHNVNLVTPTHYVPQIVTGLIHARRRGLTVPVVYNCGGYEDVEVLRAMDGLVEIYMPDVKFACSESSARFCDAPDYPQVVREAVREMHRQVGDLRIENGIAVGGLLVRHLVMPGGGEEGRSIIDFLHEEISRSTYVNVMAQYRPAFRAGDYAGIDRLPSDAEFREVYDHARTLGLRVAA